jgi:hypothetical protein
MLVLTVIGFSHFYLRGQAYPGRPLTPEIRGVLIAHGVSMSAWILLFVIQPWLIAARRHRAHMLLGRLGAVLAAVVVVLGVWTAFAGARVASVEMRWFGMNANQFIAIPLISVGLFGGFVAASISMRRRPQIHKALVLIGTLSAMSAPLGRIDTLTNLYVSTIFERAFSAFPATLALGLILLAVKFALERSLDRAMAIGIAVLTAAYWLTSQVARTEAWERLMAGLIGAG